MNQHNQRLKARADKRRAEMRRLRQMLTPEGKRVWTLQAIGDKYGIGRERVRQILSKE